MYQKRKDDFETWRKTRVRPAATRYYLDAYLQNLDQPAILREARAHAALYDHMPPVIRPGMELAGLPGYREPVIFNYGGGTAVDERAAHELEGGDGDIWADIEKVRVRAYKAANPDVYSEAELRSIESCAATSTWFGGHMVLDFERVLEIGLDGYARDIELARGANRGREDFYEALTVMLEAIRRLTERYAAACSGELSRALSHIAHEPPETFHQALQLVWMLHMLNGADSFGRLDYYLDPFYRADIAAGRMDERRAAELICDLVLHIEAAGAIQNMTIGGTDGAGRDFYTPLTKMILRVTRELGYKGPNLCLRVTPTMPDDIWEEAMAAIASGIGLPALYNDGLYVASLVRRGVPLELARGYCLAGCSQVMVPGMSNFANDIGVYNAAKICELAMYGGYDPRTGAQAGAVTKEAVQCDTFDQLLEAFYTQLDYFVDIETSIHNKEIPYRHSCEGYAMRTLFTRDCISSGRGAFEGGARYNNIELEIMGITNAADHLYAVKKAVYDEKRYTMRELVAALRANYEGYGEMRKYLYDEVPKFGNDVDGVDRLRADIARRLYERFNQSPACLGGVFVPGEVIFTAHEYCGWATGATGDGRLAGAVLADSAGASQGRDVNGPTALMNSVLKLPVADFLLTSVVLNMRFLPGLFKSERSARAVRGLFAGFFAQGGMQLQINVCDVETLRAAQKNPELYQSLVVRVGGYSDYFVNLPRRLQDEIICRTAQGVGA